MEPCKYCDFEAKNPAGLKTHMRAAHGIAGGANRQAAEELILALQDKDLLADVHVAKIQTLRSLADAVDRTPENAQLWRTYREAERDLSELDDDTAGEDDELAEIRGRTQMGNVTAIR